MINAVAVKLLNPKGCQLLQGCQNRQLFATEDLGVDLNTSIIFCVRHQEEAHRSPVAGQCSHLCATIRLDRSATR